MTPPVFGHGHLRLYLLSLLVDTPKHGYEFIQLLEERFGGTYTPSAGTIYPRLAKLEEEGLVTKTTEGRKSVYTITDAGRAELADRRRELESIEEDVTDSVRRLADEVRSSVQDAMRSLRADLAAAAREARQESRSAAKAETVEARGGLRDAEIALNSFRHQVRAELRALAVRGELDAARIELLTTGLAALQERVTGPVERSG